MKTITALALFALGTAPAWAQFRVNFFPVPALDEGGLIALVAVVGVVGAYIARRRRK